MVKIKWQHKTNGSTGEISLLESEVREWKSRFLVREDGHYPEYHEGYPYVDRITPEGGTYRLYYYPTDYTLDFLEEVSESIEVIRARKIKELSLACEHTNPYLHGEYRYRVKNIAMGKYIREGKATKDQMYRDDFAQISNTLIARLDVCIALVNSLTVEEAINAVQFNVE